MPIPKTRLDYDINKSKSRVLQKIHAILLFQFGSDIFSQLLKMENTTIEFSKNTGNMRYVYLNKERIFSYKPTVGLFSLSVAGAKVLHSYTNPPHHRVVVLSEVEDFIREGKSVFAQHITQIDEELRIGSEVLVVNEHDELIAVGKLSIPPSYAGLSVGQAVAIRKGITK